jgi:hypothetical protein
MMKRFLIEVDSHHIRVCGLVGSADVQVDDIREYETVLDAALEIEAELYAAAHETGLDDPMLRGPRKKYRTRRSAAATKKGAETLNPRGANVATGKGKA